MIWKEEMVEKTVASWENSVNKLLEGVKIRKSL